MLSLEDLFGNRVRFNNRHEGKGRCQPLIGIRRGTSVIGASFALCDITDPLDELSLAHGQFTQVNVLSYPIPDFQFEQKTASISGCSFQHAKFSQCVFTPKADIVNCIFNHALFLNCTFSGFRFNDGAFDGALFQNCTFYGASFYGSTLEGAHFLDCDFYGSDFTLLSMDYATFDKCSFEDCRVSARQLLYVFGMQSFIDAHAIIYNDVVEIELEEYLESVSANIQELCEQDQYFAACNALICLKNRTELAVRLREGFEFYAKFDRYRMLENLSKLVARSPLEIIGRGQRIECYNKVLSTYSNYYATAGNPHDAKQELRQASFFSSLRMLRESLLVKNANCPAIILDIGTGAEDEDWKANRQVVTDIKRDLAQSGIPYKDESSHNSPDISLLSVLANNTDQIVEGLRIIVEHIPEIGEYLSQALPQPENMGQYLLSTGVTYVLWKTGDALVDKIQERFRSFTGSANSCQHDSVDNKPQIEEERVTVSTLEEELLFDCSTPICVIHYSRKLSEEVMHRTASGE